MLPTNFKFLQRFLLILILLSVGSFSPTFAQKVRPGRDGVPITRLQQREIPPADIQKSRQLLTQIFQKYQGQKQKLSFGELVAKIGLEFRGQSILAHALIRNYQEKPSLLLTQQDGFSLIENSLAIARAIVNNQTTEQGFLRELEKVRYHQGKAKGYFSRWQYFYPMVLGLDSLGIAHEISRNWNPSPIKKRFCGLSGCLPPESQQKADTNLKQLLAYEKRIAGTSVMQVSIDSLPNYYPQIQEGDIIGFTTNIPQTDVHLMGLVVKGPSGDLHFLHIHPLRANVNMPVANLKDFLRNEIKFRGFVVARPISSKQQ